MLEDPNRVLIVEARSHERVADELLAGAKAALTAAGAEFEVVSVPGALAIPAVIAIAEEGGHRAAGVRFDGYVALGCVIRGETFHFEVVASESARALMDLSIGRRLAIGYGILTVDTEAQALARSAPGKIDRGGAAATACLAVVEVRRRLLGQAR
ncbi:MAG TPA: 6,7-dimethyl-8-ribityllumazine synthase [Caulobacteraceae bacterium]|jgi:6,7-dimethyl-8-ribityllumazine synthase|nr:6,7-dimethyl-8-ribityllumazine synthase [Caulobacteraceae bacterium]